MDEAARLLGVSIERLSEMRSNNEIFGYRDGPNWKFKLDELERVAAELGKNLGGEDVLDDSPDKSGSSAFLVTDSAKDLMLDDVSEQSSISGLSGLFGDDLEGMAGKSKPDDFPKGADDDHSEMESVELMEDSSVELFKKGANAGSSDDDFGLSEVDHEPESVELELADSGILKNSQNVRKERDIVPSDEGVIDDDDDLSFGASSIRLASGSSRKLLGGDDDVLDEPADKKKSPSDTGKMLGNDLNESDDLFSDEISLSESSSFDEGMELSSDFTDSGDMVLEDSDSSTEVKLEESGINLSANDSGILVSAKSKASESDIYSLELPEDDDDLIVVEGSSDDEFNLTPLADPLEDDESTGSQVIALEDSEIYADESSDSMLGEEEFQAQPAMLDDGFGLDGDSEMAGLGTGFDPMGRRAPEEAPYSLLSILSLAGLALFLMLGGMIGYSACQNMWMPDDQVANRSVLNFFLRIAGLNT
jgi:hypothetical protein